MLDGTIVGVALPANIGDLHLDLTGAQWVNSLYAVLLAAASTAQRRMAWRTVFPEDPAHRKPCLSTSRD